MADHLTPEKRSRNMSRIHSSNTKPEEKVRKYLFARGYRYRKNDKRYLGKPDIVLPKYKTFVFIQGCFWHNHQGCKYASIPKSNQDYWIPKLNKNIERDQKVYSEARKNGWNVIIIWECEIKKDFEKTMSVLEASLKEHKE